MEKIKKSLKTSKVLLKRNIFIIFINISILFLVINIIPDSYAAYCQKHDIEKFKLRPALWPNIFSDRAILLMLANKLTYVADAITKGIDSDDIADNLFGKDFRKNLEAVINIKVDPKGKVYISYKNTYISLDGKIIIEDVTKRDFRIAKGPVFTIRPNVFLRTGRFFSAYIYGNDGRYRNFSASLTSI